MTHRRDTKKRRVGLAAAVLATVLLGPAGLTGQQDVDEGRALVGQDLERVTLEEAVQRAIQRSPTIMQGVASVSGAEQSRRTAYGAFLPSVSARSGASLSSSTRFDEDTNRLVSGSSDSYNASLSASYDLFSGGRKFADLRASRADVSAAEARLDDQEFNVALQTENLFFAALRQEDLLEVARSRIARAEEGLEFVRRQVRVGAATRSDTLRSRLELVNARQAVLEAETGTRTARFALGRQVGSPAPVIPVRPEDLDPEPLPLGYAEILDLAESASPSVLAAEAATVAADAGLSAARTAYMPSIGVSGSYSWANQAASFSDGRTSWSTGLSLSYPIFNGFQRESQVQRAADQRRVTRYQEDDARLLARQEADAAYQTLRTAEQAIEIAGEALVVADEDLRVVQQRYELGVATILEVITSQVAVDEAAANLVTARYDYLLAKAELEAILGREL